MKHVYRGFIIEKVSDKKFFIPKLMKNCSTAWSCMVYIDEYLSP